jgi:carbon storage regulator
MLVLSRKAGERILIGDQITVTVVRIAPGVVRIGIDAPENLPIVREELKAGQPAGEVPHCPPAVPQPVRNPR